MQVSSKRVFYGRWLLGLLFGLAISVGLIVPTVVKPDGDPQRGQKEFLRCAVCHSAEPNVHKTGPSLALIWGKQAGTVESFSRYSDALKQSRVVWDQDTLDRWLRDPQGLIPGNRMTMRGLKDDQARQDIIAYLETIAVQNAGSNSDDSGDSQRSTASSDLPDLKLVEPRQQVQAIRYCDDTYFVTTMTGATLPIWEFNLRFKTDSTDHGPTAGRPALLPASMQGDRAIVIFADPDEISAFIRKEC